jgi:hypothetical protein
VGVDGGLTQHRRARIRTRESDVTIDVVNHALVDLAGAIRDR